MSFIKMLSYRIRKMHKFSKKVIFLSAALMAGLYISALCAYLLAPHAPEYLRAMSVCYGALEAAPATFAAGVCAALISDMALFTDRADSDDSQDGE